MRNLTLAVAVLALLASANLFAQSTNPLQQTLIDSQKAAANAEAKKDAAFFRGILAEDFTEVDPNGATTDREDFVKDIPGSDISSILLYNFKLVPLNDGAAVLTYDRVILRGKEDFGSRRYQHMSSVWVMQGGQWKLKFQQATPNQWSANDID
jgi:hypothetical protein